MSNRIIAIHLDLKGVPPTPRRLIELLPIFAAAGYNAILVEWEDMFPWAVDPRFRNATAYTPQEVARFHQAAHEHNLEIIPLVQCLGHMETPLQFLEYAHLREVPHRSDGLNPLAPGARELVEKMIDDVLALTPTLRYFHLGGDEAWTFGSHPDTHAYIAQHGGAGDGKGNLYMHHVEPLLDKLLARNIRPLLWHDMMIHWAPAALSKLATKADLCVWGYQGTHQTTNYHWKLEYIDKFKNNGIAMWGAAACKGAEFESEDLPDLEQRRINCQSWADVADRYNFAGLIATAWSRYSTDRAQDSPIDAALDSLILCGHILKHGKPSSDYLNTLETLGERQRFETCRNALQQLQDARRSFWRQIQFLRETIACCTLDPHRRKGGTIITYLLRLTASFNRTHEAVLKIHDAFKGLIPDLWLIRYLDERILPMQEEFRQLIAQVKYLVPTAYAAAYAAEFPVDAKL
ncbi:MAG: family 20 glycosylhydrolase [Phycisphaerales bacterium]|nr:family 20 glycosylhydrolase [Phycisphaerales bacterium]